MSYAQANAYSNAPEVAHHEAPQTVDPKYGSPFYSQAQIEHGQTPKLPRRLGDMKARTFWLILALVGIIVVGATIGGAVGGTASTKHSNKDNNSGIVTGSSIAQTSVSSSSQPVTTSVTASSTASVSFPASQTPTTDCPSSNTTTYQSTFLSGASGSVPSGAQSGMKFQKFCGFDRPIANGIAVIAEAFVFSFDACIELCASTNFWNDNTNCTGVAYLLTGTLPGNCWVQTRGSSSKSGLVYTGDATKNAAYLSSS